MSAVGPIALGIGCDRGTPASTLVWAVVEALATCHASLGDVVAVASIDLKADEPGLQALARWQGWTIRFYPAVELAAARRADGWECSASRPTIVTGSSPA